MKKINEIIVSDTEPMTNVLWIDTNDKSIKCFINGKWDKFAIYEKNKPGNDDVESGNNEQQPEDPMTEVGKK